MILPFIDQYIEFPFPYLSPRFVIPVILVTTLPILYF